MDDLDVGGRGGGSHSTFPQPVPAVSCYKSVFKMCRRPQGLRLTMGYPTPNPLKYPAVLQSQFSFRASQSLPGEILSVFLFPPYQVCGLSDLCQSSRGLTAVHELYRRPFAQINLIYQHRKGKRNTDESLMWEQSNVTSFKNTVGYVTFYHYNSPLKALPRHLAYVWTWNWIRLCGNSNSHQSERAQSSLYR